jgi:6-phospho-beta-glucosidase
MNDGLKIAVIGAGSTYTPELIEGLIERAGQLSVREIALMDVNEERLEIVGGLARRMYGAAELDDAVTLSTDRRRAIDGADFVLNQIRVGSQAARIRDEYLSRRHDVVGQETTGPGGFAKALRTIPVALAIAADIRELAPHAWMINFTNPAGMVTESLLRYGGVRVMGLCNSPFGMQTEIAHLLGVPPEAVWMDYVGINHLSWVRRVLVHGEDRTPEVVGRMTAAAGTTGGEFDPELIAALGMIPSGYLRYFYHQQQVLAGQREGKPSRGETVREIESRLLEMYRDPALCCKPPLLARRGGAYYSTLAVSLVDAVANDRREVRIVDCRNDSALADLAEDVAVEVPAVIGAAGARPLAAGHLPYSIRGLIQHVKAYEELTIEAATSGDERVALLALTANPLVPSFEAARALWAEIRKEHGEYLTQFAAASLSA